MRRITLIFASQDGRLYLLAPVLALSVVLLHSLEISQAQVPPPPITSSGLNTIVTTNGNIHTITGGTRPGNGPNLFHSFGEFNVPVNNIANFLNETALPTSNILGRVTAGNPSNIFGTIQTTNFGNANLFLMNPAGIIFGPNATFNVGGSVTFTEANYIRLTDNVRFTALPSAQDALLSTAPVAAFGFLDANPQGNTITIEGSALSVSDGQTLSFIGKDFTMTGGRLSAPGGQVRIASVASAGEILQQDLGTGPNINGQTFTAMGTINLSQGATVDVSADAAGTVKIRGGQFVLADSTLSADTGNANGTPIAIDINLTGDLSITSAAVPALTARTTGSGDAGEIRISSQNMDVMATGFGDFTPFSVIDTHTSGSGKAGAVSVTTTDNLTVTGDPFDSIFAIDSGTIGPDGGQGGNVTLNAKTIDIQYASLNTGDFVANNLGEEAVGSGGHLTITADSLNMVQSFMVTDGFFGGIGGNLMITARDARIKEASALSTAGTVKSGTLRINADRLVVDNSQFEANSADEPGGGIFFTGMVGEFTNGSTIQSSTFGNGDAGKITFAATERLTFSDDASADGADVRPTGLFTTAVLGTGDAAEITAITPLLEIRGGARFDATTRTSGDGGRITIMADVVSISGERTVPIFEGPLFGLAESLSSGIYSRTVGLQRCVGLCGDAGPISLVARILTLDQLAQLNSGTRSTGRGGNITATASESITINNGAGVSVSSTGVADAGNIFLGAGVQLLLQNGSVTASANQAGGGNITTVVGDTVKLVNSQFNSSVFGGTGGGGNISIDPNFVILQNSQILAQAVQGNGGNINITTQVFLADANSRVDASSQFGVNGTVNIQSPTSQLSGTIRALTQTPLQTTTLLSQRCAAKAAGQESSFVMAGRDTLPTEPGGWLGSPRTLASTLTPALSQVERGNSEGPVARGEGLGRSDTSAELGVLSAEFLTAGRQRTGEGEGLLEVGLGARGKGQEENTLTVSLRRVTPAGFLTQSFPVDWSGCPS
jgi:filamentous hemagglutinin family protein